MSVKEIEKKGDIGSWSLEQLHGKIRFKKKENRILTYGTAKGHHFV